MHGCDFLTSGAPLNSTPWMVSLSQYETYLASLLRLQVLGSGMELLSPLATMFTFAYLHRCFHGSGIELPGNLLK